MGYPAFSLTFLTFFVAKDAGIYKKHGLDVDLVQLAGAVQTSALVAGEIDLSFASVASTQSFVRAGRLRALAVSTPVKSIWAIPEDVALSTRELERLAQVLELPRDELRRRLGDTARDFVYLKRQVPPETAHNIATLAVPGVYQHPEYRRYYPAGEVTAHVLGFTGVDDRGQEGVELAHEATLAGKPGSRRVIKDRLGHIVEDVESIRTSGCSGGSYVEVMPVNSGILPARAFL